MPKKPDRIILDTNLWISFLISKDYSKLDKLLFYFSLSDIEDILDTINEHAEFVTVKGQVIMCRDPKDNFLLSLAADGQADYLLTGDHDLLALKKMNKTKIMLLSDYLKAR